MTIYSVLYLYVTKSITTTDPITMAVTTEDITATTALEIADMGKMN